MDDLTVFHKGFQGLDGEKLLDYNYIDPRNAKLTQNL